MNILLWLDQSRPTTTFRRGWIFFQLGLFVLPASAFLSILFLIVANCFGISKRPVSYWKDRWNYPFLITGLLMVIGCFRAYSGPLSWLGLANWIPFFWLFWASQPYLLTHESRRRCCLWLLAGTAPVLLTGFGQLWWNWEGPWRLWNGLIIWFISANGNPEGRLSGLFDYANIAGAWFSIVWPFALAAFLQPFGHWSKKVLAFCFCIAIVVAAIFTDSRNSLGGLLLSTPFVLGSSTWFWLIPLLLIVIAPLGIALSPWFGVEIQSLFRQLIPDSLWNMLTRTGLEARPIAVTRLGQWAIAMKLVFERPIFGWGAAAFSILYPLRTGVWHGHAHNLPLELAISHGLLVASLVVFTTFGLLLVSFARKNLLRTPSQRIPSLNSGIFDRAWWASALTLVFLHGADMPFFDSRLNIVGWILLSGLRCIIFSPRIIRTTLD